MKKLLITTIIAAVASFLFTGCYDAIYQSIRNEVELESAQISGYINSMARYTDTDGSEYLYLQNGLIYYKKISADGDNTDLSNNQSHGKWVKDTGFGDYISYDYFDDEFDGYFVYKVASDSTYMYALAYKPVYNTTHGRNIPLDIKLFYCEGVGSKWNKCSSVSDLIPEYTAKLDDDNYMMDASIALFCTNTPQNAHRKAYLRIGGGDPYESADINSEGYSNSTDKTGPYIIELNGESFTDIAANTGSIGTGDTPVSEGAGVNTTAAVYYDGSVHFLNYVSAVTNETKSSDASWVYYGNGHYMYSFAVSDTSTLIKTSGPDDNVISIAVTADSIILGTEGSGAYRVKYASDEDGNVIQWQPNTANSTFSTNGDSVMYDPYEVPVLLCTDPTIGETGENAALYSSLYFKYTASNASADYDNVGLWSYYKSRGNWNRE